MHVGFEGDGLQIGGLDVWKHRWQRVCDQEVPLPHPQYPNQIHKYEFCEVGEGLQAVRFAVDELSNGVFGFYAPLPGPRPN